MTKQADGQEEENKTIEHDLGRRNYDPSNIGFAHLLEEVRSLRIQINNENARIREDVSNMKEILNNGIRKQTKLNTEELKNVCSRVDDINEVLTTDKSHKEGMKGAILLGVKIVGLIGSGVVGTLAILNYLGAI